MSRKLAKASRRRSRSWSASWRKALKKISEFEPRWHNMTTPIRSSKKAIGLKAKSQHVKVRSCKRTRRAEGRRAREPVQARQSNAL